MHYLYLDFETSVTATLNVKKMMLGKYLDKCDILTLAWACDSLPVNVVVPGTPGWTQSINVMLQYARDPGWCFVAHNAGFDIRVLTRKLKFPHPENIDCSLELAHAWTPNQPGGYSLANLAKHWNLRFQKLDLDLMKPSTYTQQQLEDYCKQDVEACRELHIEALRRLPACEIRVQRMTQRVKEMEFNIDTQAVADAVDGFSQVAQTEALAAAALLGSDEGFGDEAGVVTSVKPADIKRMLLDNLGFDTHTITVKKIDPAKLQESPEAAAILGLVGDANKALSRKRKIRTFLSALKVYLELVYFAAHTGRFSSKSQSKGLNLHNLDKRNPVLAKLIRRLFALDDDLCFVCGDLSNIEYRIEAWLCDAAFPTQLFTANVFADPYCSYWEQITGQKISKQVKTDAPKRHLAKGDVLGLGFLMGLTRKMEELMRVLANPLMGVTLTDLDVIIQQLNWQPCMLPKVREAQTKLRAPWQVALMAYESHTRFHALHPEYGRLARWLVTAVDKLAVTRDPLRALDLLYRLPTAPNRDKLELLVDDTIQGRSVRVRAGNWAAPTVVWRDLAVRQTKYGVGMSSMLAGNKGWRRLSPQVLIENVTQTCARNALVAGQLELETMGYPYQVSIHDEEKLVVHRNAGSILQARKDMLSVFGPGNKLGYDWAVLVNPDEMTVSQTLWEDEKLMAQLWPMLEQGDESLLAHLP